MNYTNRKIEKGVYIYIFGSLQSGGIEVRALGSLANHAGRSIYFRLSRVYIYSAASTIYRLPDWVNLDLNKMLDWLEGDPAQFGFGLVQNTLVRTW